MSEHTQPLTLKPYVPEGVDDLDEFLSSEESVHDETITCPNGECGKTLTLADHRLEWYVLQVQPGVNERFIMGPVPGYECKAPCSVIYFREDVLDIIATTIQEDLTLRGLEEIYHHPKNVRSFSSLSS